MGQINRKQLARNARAEALIRMEEAARTVEDFQAVIEEWDRRDANRERRQRLYEVQRTEDMLELGYTGGQVYPIPYFHPSWRETINGEFDAMIYDNANEMWQIVEDWDIAKPIKTLTEKQKDVLFLTAVRHCTPQQIACYQDKTDRAVRKLLAAALAYARDHLAFTIRERIDAEMPDMTWMKRTFLAWYEEQQKIVLDKSTSKE